MLQSTTLYNLTGEFATQTCFQGRFGEEIGSDQFGAQIMLSTATPGDGLVTGRIENIEVTYAGQAFRLGRYAIHFHLNGDMQNSYVKHTSIHKSFNRAVNMHATNYVTIENNVVYDIMGGALFLEDGVEIGNVYEYNLVVFVHASTSLQNDDITPAAFWVTNANNTYQHNTAVGGSHFGWWYRMHDRPDGPSYDPNYCPKKIPMGRCKYFFSKAPFILLARDCMWYNIATLDTRVVPPLLPSSLSSLFYHHHCHHSLSSSLS